MIYVKTKRQVTTSRDLGLGITATPRDEDVSRCSLPWREATSPFREVDVTTKAHQRHEGSPYSPFETTPRRRFSTTSGRPWGGLQTLTNFSGGNHKGRFLSERLLPPRSLQPPRVTRTMGKSSRLAQITNSLGAKKGKEWIYNLIGQLLSNALKSLGDLRFGVEE